MTVFYVWKEWKEMSRSKGLWMALIVVAVLSVLMLLQSRTLPSDQGFRVFLLSLYEMNVYLIPLLGLFTASFSILQEKEQKTLHMLLTKKESYGRFLLRKSAAVQCVTAAVYMIWYLMLVLPLRLNFAFDFPAYFHFLLAIAALLFVFNQIGIGLGCLCGTRMQLIGANLLVWFTLIFLSDLAFLYVLPGVTHANIFAFSLFYFVDPLHTFHFYLETSLGFLPHGHLSRLMEQMVWLPPRMFLLLDTVIWAGGAYGIAALAGRRRIRHD
ncbi:hypothetical protein PAESOLCIP111_04242 [Paenibacillus solanacearum]|uniref:Copper ABC transporter permease n=1 Tax=Paenibacillus solanacearum TaxID=2048548 RepID=A0A916K5J6_9BACL|nr:ABC transporter permease subunit [Paenibacillus solanacearum]CAG7641530.1 hypothetical protein PAESOLCIP111_04242 [Paenibacillus solanacearum]